MENTIVGWLCNNMCCIAVNDEPFCPDCGADGHPVERMTALGLEHQPPTGDEIWKAVWAQNMGLEEFSNEQLKNAGTIIRFCECSSKEEHKATLAKAREALW